MIGRSGDGVTFDAVLELGRDDFECESLERPALVALPTGGWRLYVSCATPGTKHWRVDALEAPHPGAFDARTRRTVLPGDARTGVKDPFVLWSGDRWHMWLCCHPLDEPEATDRMVTRYASSVDGLRWQVEPVALAGRDGAWDERGARVAHVMLDGGRAAAYYDGRASAAQNAEELTGLATGDSPESLRALGDGPVATSDSPTGSLRYLSVVGLASAGWRLYYEVTRRDGAHDLRAPSTCRPRGS